jgi:uncharacterized protein (TIGR00255 family)
MQSMTGFGAGIAHLENARVTVELRSVNHKHQDLRLRVPSEFLEHMAYLEQVARARLGRGRYDLSARLDGQPVNSLQLDEERIRSVYASAQRLRDELAPDSSFDFSTLLSIPDAYRSVGPKLDDTRTALRTAFDLAAAQLGEMRKSEGLTLKADLTQRLELVRAITAQIQSASSGLVEHHRIRLRTRTEALLAGTAGVSPERLEVEIALIADRSDVTEELVRLQSHFSQFSELLQADGEVGRRLDFLLQEIGREVNTIGSKCQESEVTRLVVDLKSEVERLREQVQNVE